MWACACVCMFECVSVYVCVCVCLCVLTFLFLVPSIIRQPNVEKLKEFEERGNNDIVCQKNWLVNQLKMCVLKVNFLQNISKKLSPFGV